jgi:hypothetical protein
MYRKLKRTWSHSYANYIPRFKQVFHELNKISSEEMCDRWIELNIEFYSEEVTPVNLWIRLTLPFAITLLILMFICLPLVFLITGKWRYPLSEKNTILNWFRALRLQ